MNKSTLFLALVCFCHPLISLGQSTAFTYQGRLNDGTNGANGSYDFQFGIYDSVTNGNQQGSLQTNTATLVTQGHFVVILDFGNQFPGANRWLQISVQTNGGNGFMTLSPRQQIAATPYAITAGNLLPGGLPPGMYTNAVIFSNANNVFAGNGGGLQNLNATQLTSGTLPVGTLPGVVITNGGFYRPPVSGLIEWNDPATISAANGQPLTKVSDISGNGNDLFNATTNFVLFSSDGLNGSAGINLPANWDLVYGLPPTQGYGLSNSVWQPAMNLNSTVTLVFRDMLEKGGDADNPPLLYYGQKLSLADFGTNLSYWVQPWDVDVNAMFGSVGISAPLASNVPLHGHHEPFVLTLRFSSGQPDCWLDGIQVVDKSLRGYAPADVIGSSFMLGNGNVAGVVSSSQFAVNGILGDVIVSTNAEPDAELKALHTYLMNKYSIGGGVQIALEGDSIMLGQYAGVFSNFTALVQSAFPASDVVCEALTGRTSGQLVVSETDWVPMQMPKTSQRIAVVMYGANDLSADVSLATYAANWNSSLTLFHQAGYRVIGCTLPSLIRETGYATTRVQMNNFIRTNAAFDAIADFAADPLMGYLGAYTNTIYFRADQIHLTGAGYIELMNHYLYPVLASLMNPSVLLTNSTGVTLSGAFAGNGAGLTNLNTTNLVGAIQVAQLPGAVITNGQGGVNVSGSFSGNGSGLTNLSSAALAAGGGVTNNAVASIYNRPALTGVALWADPFTITGPNNQPLPVVPDTSGNGNTLYNGTSNKVLYYATGLNGFPGFGFPSTYANGSAVISYCLTNQIWTPAMNSNSCITMVFKDYMEDAIPDPYLFAAGTNLSYVANAYDTEHSGGSIFVQAPLSNRQNLQGSHLPYVFSVRLNQGLIDFWFDGAPTMPTLLRGQVLANGLGNTLAFGNAVFGSQVISESYGFGSVSGVMGDIIVHTNPPSDQELSKLHGYLLKKYGIGGGVEVILEGVNQMQGAYSTNQNNLQQLVQRALPGVFMQSVSDSGQSTALQLSSQSNWCQYAVPGTAAKKIVVEWWGEIDMQYSWPFSAFTNDCIASVNLLHSAGMMVVGCTLVSDTNELSRVMTRAEANNFIKNSGIYDYVCDFAADPDMGYNGAYTNTTFFFYNTVYAFLTSQGYDRLANRWLIPLLSRIINGGSTAVAVNGTFAGNWTNRFSVPVAVVMTNNAATAVFNASGVNVIPASANPASFTVGIGGWLTNSSGGGYYYSVQ